MKTNNIGLVLFLHFLNYCFIDGDALTIVIRNMHESNSRKKANEMKANLLEEAKHLQDTTVNVLTLHEKWAPPNAWTILPILSHLYIKYHTTSKWIFFCEDTTEINLKFLTEVLSTYNHTEKLYLGHALHDEEASIIHHYAFFLNPSEFKFADFDAGWAVSMELLKDAVRRLETNPPEMGFTIDLKHEVAMLFYDDGKGTNLTNVPYFCINKSLKEKCASTVRYTVPDCGVVPDDDILVAVKTCKKYHIKRIPIVKKTSAVNVKHIRYYSDVSDESIPTEFIGVKNTKSGHCAKLRKIISKFNDKEWQHMKWLVIIDDDTIMNFQRLQKLLACYSSDEAILLGERYGYGVNYRHWGYSYPTGGGGMIMNRKAVDMLEANHRCKCHSDDAPDDMWLGSCFQSMVPMVHSNSLHQTYPSQYSKEFLSHRYLVSFHKHEHQDPVTIYKDYLGGEAQRDVKTEL